MVCPKCRQRSLWYNERDKRYECLNLDCGIAAFSVNDIEKNTVKPQPAIHNAPPPNIKLPKPPRHNSFSFPNGYKAFLLILILSITGLIISGYTSNLTPFWILFSFSILFSIEKWFGFITRKHKTIGKLYRLLLNLGILSLLGFVIWSGTMLFSQHFMDNSLTGSLVFLGECIFFLWLWRIVLKNSWRWPSMKLTIVSLIAAFLVFSFAGVQPLATYKDTSFSYIGSFFKDFWAQTTQTPDITQIPDTTTATVIQTTYATVITPITTMPATAIPSTTYSSINPKTGVYKNYYLGLVYGPEGVISGNDCYGEFIVLINNKNAQNPTRDQLVDFLKKDGTDWFPYQLGFSIGGFYYGSAESHIDLENIKSIIDGSKQPNPPRICADFAERLHNAAERAGIRCGYVTINLDDGGGHALNAFETVDAGLIYIDDTGKLFGFGPSNCDKVVDVRVGVQYIPRSVFPEVGWSSIWDSLGIVTSMYMTWDGNWNN